MERFVKGDFVVLPFPFSDLSSSKKRPALVFANLKGDDSILCRITSQYVKDIHAIRLENIALIDDFLSITSNIRPNRLFTAEKKIILRKIAKVSDKIFEVVTTGLCELIQK